ncbi:MAG: type II toxin-antitoxin system Phd/YefM family antitoxin [Spirochaetaceae bacterium]|nr:MAG: type II toxin-antitoxin system Phd/YefM family antitoxin [Spirochaetaceae bacterium]
MKTMPVGEFKANFSEVVEQVKRGEEIVISYGRKRENVAVLIPYSTYTQNNAVSLGQLQGKASVSFADDFEMSGEELLGE